jgi:hypothetical protein
MNANDSTFFLFLFFFKDFQFGKWGGIRKRKSLSVFEIHYTVIRHSATQEENQECRTCLMDGSFLRVVVLYHPAAAPAAAWIDAGGRGREQ